MILSKRSVSDISLEGKYTYWDRSVAKIKNKKEENEMREIIIFILFNITNEWGWSGKKIKRM
jgi:hypothetical protein